MQNLFDVELLLQRQLREVAEWHQGSILLKEDLGFQNLVSVQHHTNFELWHEEDQARDLDASDSQIAGIKRSIDRLNQKRHDQIEVIDQWLHSRIEQLLVEVSDCAKLNSETPGSLIDRLSINALKIFHMDEETRRSNASAAHKKKCSAKLQILEEQRGDLSVCLRELVSELETGKKILKIYRQLKMYNDASLNPVLYHRKTSP